MPRARASTPRRHNTQNPYLIFDNIMDISERFQARRFTIENFNQNITHTEFITLTALCDRTILYGKFFECIPKRHILTTIMHNSQGEVDGYPLCRKSLTNALTNLQTKGYIIGLHHPNLDQWANFYGLNFFYTFQQNDLANSCYSEAFNACINSHIRFMDETTNYINEQMTQHEEYFEWLQNSYNVWSARQHREREQV